MTGEILGVETYCEWEVREENSVAKDVLEEDVDTTD